MKDERLVSKMEDKTNFSRDLKHFDGLVRLTPTLMILRQIYAVVQAQRSAHLWHCCSVNVNRFTRCRRPLDHDASASHLVACVTRQRNLAPAKSGRLREQAHHATHWPLLVILQLRLASV